MSRLVDLAATAWSAGPTEPLGLVPALEALLASLPGVASGVYGYSARHPPGANPRLRLQLAENLFTATVPLETIEAAAADAVAGVDLANHAPQARAAAALALIAHRSPAIIGPAAVADVRLGGFLGEEAEEEGRCGECAQSGARGALQGGVGC